MTRRRLGKGPRVNVDYAGVWAAKPYRFWDLGSGTCLAVLTAAQGTLAGVSFDSLASRFTIADRIAKIVNATVITLDQAPQGYQDFDKGAAKKFVLDPHGLLAKAA